METNYTPFISEHHSWQTKKLQYLGLVKWSSHTWCCFAKLSTFSHLLSSVPWLLTHCSCFSTSTFLSVCSFCRLKSCCFLCSKGLMPQQPCICLWEPSSLLFPPASPPLQCAPSTWCALGNSLWSPGWLCFWVSAFQLLGQGFLIPAFHL